MWDMSRVFLIRFRVAGVLIVPHHGHRRRIGRMHHARGNEQWIPSRWKILEGVVERNGTGSAIHTATRRYDAKKQSQTCICPGYGIGIGLDLIETMPSIPASDELDDGAESPTTSTPTHPPPDTHVRVTVRYTAKLSGSNTIQRTQAYDAI